jgi:hypothetical protein
MCRSQWLRGLRRRSVCAPLACWDCGFESRRGYGCLSLVSVGCCQVDVTAASRSLFQRSPAECDVSVCDLETSKIRRPRPYTCCCANKNALHIPLFYVSLIWKMLLQIVSQINSLKEKDEALNIWCDGIGPTTLSVFSFWFKDVCNYNDSKASRDKTSNGQWTVKHVEIRCSYLTRIMFRKEQTAEQSALNRFTVQPFTESDGTRCCVECNFSSWRWAC